MSNGNFTSFLEALGAFESGINPTEDYGTHDLDWLMVFDPSKGNVDRESVNLTNNDDLSMLQYHVHNTLGFLGKYQFGEPLLIDLGYYSPAPTGFYGATATNEWKGTWTGKNGIDSKEEFMSIAQELAIRDAFTMNMGVIDKYLSQAGKTLDDYLGKEISYVSQGVEHTTTVSLSGILASAHLQGPGGVAQLLLNNQASHDEYGTNILSYMDWFGGYETPFGSAADDILSGSDYSETFAAGAGQNSITTGDGEDKIIIKANAGGQDIIKDFDIHKDVISLSDFNGLQFSGLSITANAQGNAVIQFPANQTVVLEGVAPLALTAAMFVYGPYALGWKGNAGDIHIDNFNPHHDLLDFNYAFSSENLSVYEQNGSTVIEVTGNNQRYILDNISLDELTMGNFVKAPIDFAAKFMAAAGVIPPVDTSDSDSDAHSGSGSTGGENPTNNVDTHSDDHIQQATVNHDVFSYNWNWGAQDVIKNFDVAHDQIDLQSFWTSYDGFKIYNDTQGNAVIDLNNLNSQTITLEGISASQLSANNIKGVLGDFSHALSSSSSGSGSSSGATDSSPSDNSLPTDSTNSGSTEDTSAQTFSYTWNWGNNAVVDHFDTTQDTVDLSGFWTDYSHLKIYQSGNDTLIDLKDLNNQTIKLAGVNVADLNSGHIKGVLGSLSQALTQNDSGSSPGSSSPSESGSTTTAHVQNEDGSTLFGTTGQDVYKFTWAWGSHSTIENFDTAHDKIDLKSFWTSADQVSIHNDTQGNAIIDLTNLNNQTIKLAGVSANEVHPDNLLF